MLCLVPAGTLNPCADVASCSLGFIFSGLDEDEEDLNRDL